MPRSYSNWNSRRRPEPRLFQTFGSPSETSPLAELAARGPLAAGFGDDEMLPSASSPNDASLDLEDLVAGIAEGDAEFFASDVLGGGVGVGLNAATASSPLTLAALQQQQAQQHQFAQLQQLQQLQQALAVGQLGNAGQLGQVKPAGLQRKLRFGLRFGMLLGVQNRFDFPYRFFFAIQI